MHEVTVQNIQSAILTLPGRPPFMVTKQLAELYETNSERVLQAYRRNLQKFPEDFVFRLTEDEAKTLQSEGSLVYLGGALPYGFYRNGCNMLSCVLQGDVADERSIQIMRAFSAMEEMSCALVPGDKVLVDKNYFESIAKNSILQEKTIGLLEKLLENAENKPHRRINFTPDQDTRMLELREQGLSHLQIGRELGRSKNSIASRLRRLGRAN